MAPEPGDVGPSYTETGTFIDSLANRLGAVLDKNGPGKYRLQGFIVEPSAGFIHPVVVDDSTSRDEKVLAMGGPNLERFLPIEVANENSITVHWGGKAGARNYLSAKLNETDSRGFRAQIIKSDYAVGFEIINFRKEGVESVDGLNTDGYFLETPTDNSSHTVQVQQALNAITKYMPGNQVEILGKFEEGLEKAGLPANTQPSKASSP